MKSLQATLAMLIILGISGIASASSISWHPNPSDLYDLDHYGSYTWRIDNVNLANQTITGATLTIHNIANWNDLANRLFIHMLDTARNPGVASYTDSVDDAVIDDNFAGALYLSNPLVTGSTTANTFLDSPSFTTTPKDYVFNFTAPELTTLRAYLDNGGNVAIGFDPDCHFTNDGITFQIVTTPLATPEPGSMVLLGTCLSVGMIALRRRCRRR